MSRKTRVSASAMAAAKMSAREVARVAEVQARLNRGARVAYTLDGEPITATEFFAANPRLGGPERQGVLLMPVGETMTFSTGVLRRVRVYYDAARCPIAGDLVVVMSGRFTGCGYEHGWALCRNETEPAAFNADGHGFIRCRDIAAYQTEARP
jgi:hypothetical protein